MYGAGKLDILKMMQVNSMIFGKEICEIIDAKEAWIIRYFEKQLYHLLNNSALEKSKYVTLSGNGWNGVTDVLFEGFNLDLKQCSEIGNFIISRVTYERSSCRLKLDESDSMLVISYIDKTTSGSLFDVIEDGGKHERNKN